MIAESTVNNEFNNHTYAEDEIAGIPFKGLLDSGSNISCLGKGFESFLNESNIKFCNMPSELKTAIGEIVRIFGHTKVKVKFNGEKNIYNCI